MISWKYSVKFPENDTRNRLRDIHICLWKELTFCDLTCCARSNTFFLFFFNYLLYARAHVPLYDFYTIKREIGFSCLKTRGTRIRGNVVQCCFCSSPLWLFIFIKFNAISAIFLHSRILMRTEANGTQRDILAELLFLSSLPVSRLI